MFTCLLVICVGQSTTDDTYTNEIDDLRAYAVAQIAELKGHLAAALDEITKLKEKQKSDDSKFSIVFLPRDAMLAWYML